MECICLRECTIRHNNKSLYFEKDQIVEFEKCPKHHFKALNDAEVDFDTATEELLLMSKNWKLKDALAYLKEKYNHTVSGPPVTRKDIAKLIVDMRFRKVTIPEV